MLISTPRECQGRARGDFSAFSHHRIVRTLESFETLYISPGFISFARRSCKFIAEIVIAGFMYTALESSFPSVRAQAPPQAQWKQNLGTTSCRDYSFPKLQTIAWSNLNRAFEGER